MNPCHSSFSLKELEEAPRHGALVQEQIYKGMSIAVLTTIAVHTPTAVHMTISTHSSPSSDCQSTLHQLLGAGRESLPTLDASHLKSNVAMSYQRVFKPSSHAEALVA